MSSTVSALQSPPSSLRTLVTKVCIVGKCTETAVVSILKEKFRCEIYYSDTGLDFYDDDDMVFFVCDFESAEFETLYGPDGASSRKIIGPGIVKTRYAARRDLYRPRQNRPIYCEIMKDVSIVFGSDLIDKRKYVDFVHFMGGHARKEANGKTNVLLTNHVIGSVYRKLAILESRILRPEWIEECWRNRDNPKFDVFDKDLIQRVRVGAFEGLHIYFHGFTEDDKQDMVKSVLENSGQIVDDVSMATHVVINPNPTKVLERLDPYHNQKHVTNEWLWMSAHMQYCANEDLYGLQNKALRRTRALIPECDNEVQIARQDDENVPPLQEPLTPTSNNNPLQTVLNATPDYLYSTDDLREAVQSPVRLDKDRQVCMEMVETEKNYLTALNILLKFRIAIEEADKQEQLITHSELAIIFNKIQPIIDVHEVIFERLSALVKDWKSVKEIAKVWSSSAPDLEKVYASYMNSYDTAKATLENADSNNPKFHAFVRAKESNTEFKRNTLKELLIRPVQRLPSVVLLLKEVQKKSDKSYSKCLQDAINAVHNVLNHSNYVREINDRHIDHLTMFNEIEGVPADLVCSKRSFICDVLAYSIWGTSNWENMERKEVRLLLFNDVILVCKVRSSVLQARAELAEGKKLGTFSRLSRQASLASLRFESRKPYKFLCHIPNQYIREVKVLRPELEITSESEDKGIFSPDLDDNTIFHLTVRVAISDDTWLIQPKCIQKMQVFLEYIAERLYIDNGRDIRGNDIFLATNNERYVNEFKEPLYKYLKSRGSLNATLPAVTHFPSSTSCSSVPRPPSSGFRRAISNASLHISNTFGFGRSHGTSNLSHIDENSPPVRSLEEDMTPKRGLRARLTSSTFLNRTLRRRESVLANRTRDNVSLDMSVNF